MKVTRKISVPYFRLVTELSLVTTLLVALTTMAFASGPLEKVIYAFKGGSDGQFLAGGVIADKNGNLYGTTAGSFDSGCPTGCGTVFELSPPTTVGGNWIKTQLYSFQGGNNDGAEPVGALVFDNSGNLYGSTFQGGPGNTGATFELSPPSTPGGTWTETILNIFPADGSGGINPRGSLIFDAEGNLYGVTYSGGLPCNCGTVFERSPPAAPGSQWTQTVLHTFAGAPKDGAAPSEGLLFDRSGALYGTTWGGGINTVGIAFQMKRHNGVWAEKTIATFTALDPGLFHPYGGLAADAAGNIYGTATEGGWFSYIYAAPCVEKSGCGGVFELSPPTTPGGHWTGSGQYEFWRSGPKRGDEPVGRILIDDAGNLYGVTGLGGLNGNQNPGADGGTIFRLTPSAGQPWTATILHAFAGVTHGDGASPNGSLIMVNGKFYGTTQVGGTGTCSYSSIVNGCGTVYSLTIVP